jgi:hypothetical protein
MIKISREGTTRNPVIVIGPLAFKWARNELGRICNLRELAIYRDVNPVRRAMLCPAIWASRRGQILVMRSAIPTSEMMSLDEYLDMDQRWDAQPGEPNSPFEPGARNWGWLGGRRVAIDYAIDAVVEYESRSALSRQETL